MDETMTAQEGAELSVEEIFARLEKMADTLEDGSVPLEEAFRIYAGGMELLKTANATIDGVEKQMQILLAEVKDGDDEGET